MERSKSSPPRGRVRKQSKLSATGISGRPARRSRPNPDPQAEPKDEPKAVAVTPKPALAAPESFKELTPRQTFTPATDTEPAQKIPGPLPPVIAPNPVVKPADPQAACDYRLSEIWESQVIKIENVEHWMARAFTLDLNADGEVDNISFTFVAKDESERVIHYTTAPGEISGRMYPALSLPDESVIRRLCFDDLTYKKPKFFGSKNLPPTLIEMENPDLAGRMKAKQQGVAYVSKSKKKKKRVKKGESTPWWMWRSMEPAGLWWREPSSSSCGAERKGKRRTKTARMKRTVTSRKRKKGSRRSVRPLQKG